MSGSSSKGSSRPGKLAQHIEQLIDRSPKTQREIAREAGYENPNIITMLKQGHTRVPLDKVGPLAKALDADPVHLLRLVMREYMPDTLIAIEPCLGYLVSEHERGILVIIREATHNQDPGVKTAKQRVALEYWAETLLS